MKIYIRFLLYLCIFFKEYLFIQSILQVQPDQEVSIKSPYYQYLPDCKNFTKRDVVQKKTKMKGIICPLVKNEEGFLSEWTAYYEMQGFDHIIFYDDNSTLGTYREIRPWIQSGFAEVRTGRWWKKYHLQIVGDQQELFQTTIKPLDFLNQYASIDCKKTAIRLGYDIFLSVDIDEYILPRNHSITIMDELSDWFLKMNKHIVYLKKYNFSPVPHIHEPVQLLTIEAYQTRYPIVGKMTFYITTADKIAIHLQSPTFTVNTTTYITYCCHLHGCTGPATNFLYTIDSINCTDYLSEYSKLWPQPMKGSKLPWINPPDINHYARSLEKFALKQDSWRDLAVGNDSMGNGQGLSVYNYMNRAYGYYHDEFATKYFSCSLRYHLRMKTGRKVYLRPGNHWYRNIEYGKKVKDGRKRGRNGQGYEAKLKRMEVNPYHFPQVKIDSNKK